MEGVEIRVVRKAKREEVVGLYRAAGWWKPEYDRDTSFIDAIITGSLCFVGAFHAGRMVGMGRAISDGVSDAYIQDVTVLEDYRGRGIGRGIVREITRILRGRGIDWIGLIAEPGTERFYARLGFNRMRDHVPMVCAGDDGNRG